MKKAALWRPTRPTTRSGRRLASASRGCVRRNPRISRARSSRKTPMPRLTSRGAARFRGRIPASAGCVARYRRFANGFRPRRRAAAVEGSSRLRSGDGITACWARSAERGTRIRSGAPRGGRGVHGGRPCEYAGGFGVVLATRGPGCRASPRGLYDGRLDSQTAGGDFGHWAGVAQPGRKSPITRGVATTFTVACCQRASRKRMENHREPRRLPRRKAEVVDGLGAALGGGTDRACLDERRSPHRQLAI